MSEMRNPTRLPSCPVYEMIRPAPAKSFVLHRHDYPADCARWNYHPEYELHLITASHGRYVVGDFVGSFGPGNLVLVGPDLPHNWLSDIPPHEVVSGRDLVLQIQSEWLQGLVALCPEFGGVSRLLQDAANGVEFFGPRLEALRRRMVALEQADEGRRVAMVIALLVELAATPRRVLCLGRSMGVSGLDEMGTMDMTIRHLLSSDLREVSQADVARRARMSPSGFSRLFQQATGNTFTAFVRRLRISRACELLVTTRHSIAVVGAEAGFSNLSNFNRYFLKEKRVTPKQYRRDALQAMAGKSQFSNKGKEESAGVLMSLFIK